MQIDGHKDVGIVIFNAPKRNTKTRVIICCLNICLALTQTKFSLSEQLKKYLRNFSVEFLGDLPPTNRTE